MLKLCLFNRQKTVWCMYKMPSPVSNPVMSYLVDLVLSVGDPWR